MKKDISHIINHLGEDRKEYFNAISPPIIQSSNFCFPDFKTLKDSLKKESNFIDFLQIKH